MCPKIMLKEILKATFIAEDVVAEFTVQSPPETGFPTKINILDCVLYIIYITIKLMS